MCSEFFVVVYFVYRMFPLRTGTACFCAIIVFCCCRRHVLTEDDASPPNVALWDITKAKQIEAYPPGTVMEDKERLLLEIIAVRPWFTIDTHLGTPLVSLSEGTVFLGELYAVDARGERQTFLASLPPLQPSQPGRRGLPLATDASAARAGGAGKGGDGPARATKARSVQDEVKVTSLVAGGICGRGLGRSFVCGVH